MADDTGFILEYWLRQETFLALYRERSATDPRNAKHLYESLWELSFPVEHPLFLSTYDLIRSSDSTYRRIALKNSQLTINHLRNHYGPKWFKDKKWTQRIREYWWEGFRLTTSDIVDDAVKG